MKIKRIDKEVKTFKPVVFEVTLESIEDVRAWMAELNSGYEHIDTQYKEMGFKRHDPSHDRISDFYFILEDINGAYEEQ